MNDNDNWHANKNNYDEYLTPDVENKAEIFGRLKHLCDNYSRVVVVAQFHKNSKHHNREVLEDELSYDRERDSLDIYGRPATGRFVNIDSFRGIKVWE